MVSVYSAGLAPLPRDWNCPSGRRCHTWPRTFEADLSVLSDGLATAYHWAQNQLARSALVGMTASSIGTSHTMTMFRLWWQCPVCHDRLTDCPVLWWSLLGRLPPWMIVVQMEVEWWWTEPTRTWRRHAVSRRRRLCPPPPRQSTIPTTSRCLLATCRSTSQIRISLTSLTVSSFLLQSLILQIRYTFYWDLGNSGHVRPWTEVPYCDNCKMIFVLLKCK